MRAWAPLHVHMGAARHVAHAVPLSAEALAPGNILLDPESELMRLTGARALPTTLFFDADGRLRGAHMGELSRATLEARLRELQ